VLFLLYKGSNIVTFRKTQNGLTQWLHQGVIVNSIGHDKMRLIANAISISIFPDIVIPMVAMASIIPLIMLPAIGAFGVLYQVVVVDAVIIS
jgi:hypothetical protein